MIYNVLLLVLIYLMFSIIIDMISDLSNALL